jgi:hypothetical protein
LATLGDMRAKVSIYRVTSCKVFSTLYTLDIVGVIVRDITLNITNVNSAY